MARFLPIFLGIDAVLDQATIGKRRERLGLMTSGLRLDGAYDATLDRIKGQGKRQINTAWLHDVDFVLGMPNAHWGAMRGLGSGDWLSRYALREYPFRKKHDYPPAWDLSLWTRAQLSGWYTLPFKNISIGIPNISTAPMRQWRRFA